MLRRYAKAGVLVVLVVEGYFGYRWYDRYHGHDAGGATDPKAVEATGPGTTQDTEDAEPAGEAAFVHTATDGNNRGDYTYLSDPGIDGDPNASVLVALSADRASAGGGAYAHNIGVRFEPEEQRWAIFNQDRTAVPAGAAFEVVVPRGSDAFVHRSELANTVGNSTYPDDPLTNGEPEVSVTQNWNPGGGVGVYNDHPVGVLYDEDVDEWAIYNRDSGPMPDGTAFNVAVSGDPQPTG